MQLAMRQPLGTLAIVCATLVGMFTAGSRRASACVTALPCWLPVRLFAPQLPDSPDIEVPGDLVYFKVLVPDPGPLSLRTKSGEPIEASIRMIGLDRVFAPDAPIDADTDVVLEYTSCGLGPPEEPSANTYEFHTVKATGPVALSEGELTAVGHGVKELETGSLAYQRIRYVTPEGVGSHLMDVMLTVDGTAWSLWLPGVDVSPDYALTTICPAADRPSLDSCGGVSSVLPGTHEIVATTTVVGLSEQPAPLKLVVETECADATDAAVPATPMSDAGSHDAAPLRADDSNEADGTGAAGTSVEPKSSDSGCAVRAGNPASASSWLGLALTTIGLALRRRSRQRKSH